MAIPDKRALLNKLTAKPIPRNFTIKDLDALMSKCDCEKYSGGRGSGIGYLHKPTKRALQFDAPHPGKELYIYQVKAVIAFLKTIGEIR